MTGFVLRRLLTAIPVIIVASFVVFVLVAATGDPLAELRSRPGVSQETIQLRERELNLDKSIPQRYVTWAGNFVRGDLGRSIGGESVNEMLPRAFGVTFRMVFLALLIAALVAIVIGVTSAVRQYSLFDFGGTFFAFLFFSMPVFWLAGILKDLGVRFNEAVDSTVFYTVGERTPNLRGGFFETLPNRLGHLALPTLTLALISVAAYSRFQRASMLDVLSADYVRTARAKGLPERRVIFKHALRNALIPLVTYIAIDFGQIIGGAVLTEIVFAWRGLGRMLIEGLNSQDVNVVSAVVFLTAIIVVVFNLIADVLYGYLDPRIRHG